MNEPSATRPAANEPSAPDRMALLHALMFTAVRLCVAQFDGFSSRLVGALARQAEQAADTAEAHILRHAWQHLNPHRPTFHRLLGDSLQQALLDAIQGAAARDAAQRECVAKDPPPMSFAAMEREILLDSLSQSLDETDADALAALRLRIAHWLHAGASGAVANPFRSEVFLRAVADAWQKFDGRSDSQRLVLRQMRADVFLQLGPVWQALNRDLAARGVLPDAEEICRRQRAAESRPRAFSRQEHLCRWLAPQGILSQTRTTALLDGLFEQIAGEQVIPPAIRALLARLKEPLRKAVPSDMTFFFNERHPARRLIEAIIDGGLGCEADKRGEGRADPLYQAAEQAVERVLQLSDMQNAQLDEIVGFLAEAAAQHSQVREGALREPIADAVAQENMAHAQQLAEEDVAARLETGEVPGFVESLLQAQWTRVLAFAYGVRDAKPDVLVSVRKAMDDLIWSVRPRAGAEERKELVARLPALLAMLNAWLNVVKWEGAERQAFFAALAERHAAIMRGPAEMTPRDQLELRMTVVQKASEHQLSRRAQEQKEHALAEFRQQIDRLAPGDWVEFVRNNGSKVNCRLAWISAGHSRLIFVGRQGKLIFTLDQEALAQALRARRAAIIAIDPLRAALERLGSQ